MFTLLPENKQSDYLNHALAQNLRRDKRIFLPQQFIVSAHQI